MEQVNANGVARGPAGAFAFYSDGDAMVLEWRTGRRSGRREMNRQWVHVLCDCSAPGRNCHLSVKSHGLETEVGHYLSDEARLKLAATLRNQLQG